MDLMNLIEGKTPILTEGSVFEALRRNPAVKLHPVLAHAPLVYDNKQAQILTQLYREYFDISKDCQLPMLAFTNTWRANKLRLEKTEFKEKNINRDCVQFLKNITKSYSKILVGGLIGCVGDAYKPEESLSEAESETVHSYQTQELAKAGVDFLFASTLPATTEALGMAKAMSQCDLPYVLSFVIRPNGKVLDGTFLDEAIRRIDQAIRPMPSFYLVNCVHPSIFSRALDALGSRAQVVLSRVRGFQGNTSALSPEELDGAEALHTEDPEIFGKLLAEIFYEHRLRIVSGCCGTDARHIRALAKQFAQHRVEP